MRPLERLDALLQKQDRIVVGLSSGTSADGVDAALVRIRGNGLSTQVELLSGRTCHYSDPIREAVVALVDGTTAEVCRLNFRLGEIFAEAAVDVIHDAGMTLEDVDLIGSHGQTVYHIPRTGQAPPSSLQIGEADVIAEVVRTPVISDFRMRDIAAGGDGAPLLPYVDFLLLRREGEAVAVQNIGGIANVNVITEEIEGVFALDTGPGNMPLDTITRILTRGEESYDRDGKHSARGRIDEGLLAHLLAHPYLAQKPPKSTGREMFGEAYVMEILKHKGNSSLPDVLATMTLFVAKSIRQAYDDFVLPRVPIEEVLVSGGGLRNHTLMAHLRRLFHPLPVRSLAERGIDPDLKEALAFAVLANETLFGNPNNVPSATGARWPVVLGKISP